MTTIQFFTLLATIWIAPHAGVMFGRVVGFVFAWAAIFLMAAA